MICPKCGKEINQDDVICLNCGTLLTSMYRPQTEQVISNNNDIISQNATSNNNFINNEQVLSNYLGNSNYSEVPIYGEIAQENNEINQPQVMNQPAEIVNPQVMNQPTEVVSPQVMNQPTEVVSPQVMNQPTQIVNPQVMNQLADVVSPQVMNQPAEIVNPQVMNQPVEVVSPQVMNQPTEIVNPQVMNQPVEIIPTVIPPIELNNGGVPSVVPIMEQDSTSNEDISIKENKTKEPKKKRIKQKNKPKNNKIIYLVALVSVFVVVVLIGVYLLLSNKAPKNYTLGDDKFPSITAVVGSRNLVETTSTTENEIVIKKYHYTKIKNVMTDLYQYIGYLMQSLNYVNTTAYDLNEESGIIQLGNESTTSGYVINIIIEYNTDEYTITIKKVPGTLTRY